VRCIFILYKSYYWCISSLIYQHFFLSPITFRHFCEKFLSWCYARTRIKSFHLVTVSSVVSSVVYLATIRSITIVHQFIQYDHLYPRVTKLTFDSLINSRYILYLFIIEQSPLIKTLSHDFLCSKCHLFIIFQTFESGSHYLYKEVWSVDQLSQ